MDRQAAALFGGIVAVGLGPAVWLGGTLLRPDSPSRPVPTVVREASASPTDGEPAEPAVEVAPSATGDVSGGGADAAPSSASSKPNGHPTPSAVSTRPAPDPTASPSSPPPSTPHPSLTLLPSILFRG